MAIPFHGAQKSWQHPCWLDCDLSNKNRNMTQLHGLSHVEPTVPLFHVTTALQYLTHNSVWFVTELLQHRPLFSSLPDSFIIKAADHVFLFFHFFYIFFSHNHFSPLSTELLTVCSPSLTHNVFVSLSVFSVTFQWNWANLFIVPEVEGKTQESDAVYCSSLAHSRWNTAPKKLTHSIQRVSVHLMFVSVFFNMQPGRVTVKSPTSNFPLWISVREGER